MYALSVFKCCSDNAATSAGQYPWPRRSPEATGVSVASTGWTVNSAKVFMEADSGALTRNRANSAIISSSEKSRVQTRRYARLDMYGGAATLYRGRANHANSR